ncbi:Renal dipeptidase family [Trinorchestia longiramus]|nr:Renal dipeptidase family [Trinorchestia longiramus]
MAAALTVICNLLDSAEVQIPPTIESEAFWVAYTPCASQYLNSVQLTLEQIDLIKRVIRKYRNFMHLVTNSQDILKVFKQGKMASMVGIEGGHGIGNSLGSLRMMYELGVRYLTLTHTCNTPWATSSIVESSKNNKMDYVGVGLSEFGKKVVLEMNRLGMMVDLSHVSTQTMRDALATTQAPVIFSHSAARAICDNPRNVPDDVLKQIQLNRGIVMVSFYADHISCDGKANVTHVADHINHIRDTAGVDHVGIGADFDGINKTPRGLEDVSSYPRLIAELLRDPRWSVDDIKKLIGGNIIRVFSEVEKKRDELQAAGYQPQEEELHPEYLRGKSNCTYSFD